MSRVVRRTVLLAPLAAWAASLVPAHAEDAKEQAALAAAMKDAKATLEGGIKASRSSGTPISAKFEVEDGHLQLSVYTMKGADFSEVVLDPRTGKVRKTEKITDAEDLEAARAQKAAMAKAKVSLETATRKAVAANAGYRAVSVVPKAGPVAEVVLLRGTSFKTVNEKLA